MRRRLVVLALTALGLSTCGVMAAVAGPPTPEPNFAASLLPEPCSLDPAPDASHQSPQPPTNPQPDPHDAAWAARDGWTGPEYERYPGACQRLRFRYGPIVVKPGQNDVMIEPITIEQPRYDGYLTRFKPDLVLADGTVPPIEQVHLHHAVWLTQIQGEYGLGNFAASGEEKTTFTLPRGYGLPVKATDDWQLLYMIHSAVPQPTTVFITYDIDYIAKAKAEAAPINMKPAYPIWLDVRPSPYPVFNAQRGFGTNGTCTWPKQNCAAFDPFGNVIPGQGAPPNSLGTGLRLPSAGQRLGRFANFQGGTLITAGGHVHPGGLSNDIELVRGTQARPIFTSEALYWDRADPTKTGGPPTSWDFSASVNALPNWGVRVEPGDVLRSNTTYDTTIQSVYEGMGIVVMYIAPDRVDAANPTGVPTAPGVNPFDAAVGLDSERECPSGGLLAATPTLCLKGWPTHGHLHENDNFSGPSGQTTLNAGRGEQTTQVGIGGFVYAPGDLSMISMTGIPTVKLRESGGAPLRFTNIDTFADVYHSVTSCAYPCLGGTGTAFPLSDGRTSAGRSLDFDSGELGFGFPTLTAAKQTPTWTLDVSSGKGYQPGEVVTYYCRIHPFMRGAFEVSS